MVVFALAFVVLLPWHLGTEHHNDGVREELTVCLEIPNQQNEDHSGAHSQAEHDWAALPGQGSKSPDFSDYQTLVQGSVSLAPPLGTHALFFQVSATLGPSLAPKLFRLRGPPLS